MNVAATSSAGNQTQLRQKVNEFVGLFFYGTLLKSARESRLTDSKIGFGGRGEQAFAAQLDMELAQRAGSAAGNSLSNAIARQLTGAPRK